MDHMDISYTARAPDGCRRHKSKEKNQKVNLSKQKK